MIYLLYARDFTDPLVRGWMDCRQLIKAEATREDLRDRVRDLKDSCKPVRGRRYKFTLWNMR